MDKLPTRSPELKIVTRLMQSVALWPYDYDRHLPGWLRGRYHLSTVLNVLYYLLWLFINLHILVLHVKTILDRLDSFQDLFLILVTTFIYCVMVPVSLYCQLYYEKNVELIKMAMLLFRKRSAAGITYIKFEPTRQFVFKLFKMWMIGCMFGTMHWAVYPILQREKILPFQIWYPFDVHRSPLYELAFLGQVMGQYQVGMVFGLAGSLLMMHIFMVCGQFDILFCSLANVYNTAMINSGGYKLKLTTAQIMYKSSARRPNLYYFNEVHEENLPDAPRTKTKQIAQLPQKHNYLPKLSNELATALDDCIEHHSMLIKFCHKMEECYHPFIMMKLGQIVVQLCLLVYMTTSQDNLTLMKLMNICEYLMLTMTELFLLCYLGQTMKVQSMKVGDALMMSPWYECGAAFRKRTQLILINSFHPVRLTAMKLYDLDFETYYMVLKASFSYYTLLKKLQQ
ncbi:putative odorant receptor 85e [Culex quinquefasciatus]|uniref:putative odorant receptor 85e n=1 Tax=Culex quinquefasciatus TaxID=7176 RepID=UPI0018E2DE41|nr:putative odorant receptor 85e [Culex quinquefasciatus]